jgi:hypothetical protein
MKIYSGTGVYWGAFCAIGALLAAAGMAQTPPDNRAPSLRGTVSDPSGASVPGALIQVRGPGGEQRKSTDQSGHYAFPSLSPGTYRVRVIAKGFSVTEKADLEIRSPVTFDARMIIEADAQVINVEDEANRVSADPANNGGALVLREKELAALSDDPDELSQQLQAMAGPGAGPGGGQIYIDGFTGGQMPPKASIREIRINSNPFSAEYDRPGFGRIEIFTKPGTDKFRGQAFLQYNNQDLNSRSPLLTSALPPYQQRFIGGSLSGSLKKEKASFGLDFEQRTITENAFILATTLDSSFNPVNVNQAITTPQTRLSLSPRVDYKISDSNTLTVRYQFTRSSLDKQGIGDYSLASQAYNAASTENTLQATETAILSPSLVNESRFQYLRSSSANTAAGNSVDIAVQGAFTGGSATVGNSNTVTNNYEFANNTTWTRGRHVLKAGFRMREALEASTSLNNFNGTFTFLGGMGPQLDANYQPVAGTSVALTALQVYQRTLKLQSLGYSAAQIRADGGGATQFSLSAGTPLSNVSFFDAGFYFNDDWRIRSNLTLSYGLRYESQTNIGDHMDFAPRIGIAWGIDSKGTRPGKTVLRAGAGAFYDRVGESYTLNAERYNGITQSSYVVTNPDFYPTIPTTASLAASKQPQRLQPLYSGIVAPRTWQANVGIDRQINAAVKISANYLTSRGEHLINTRDINAAVNGVYPFGDSQIRLLTESAGLSRSNQLFISPNVNYRKLFLFGFYALSYGKDNNEGQPANPNNLSQEWGRSSFADVRHRAIIGTNLPMPWKVSVSLFISMSSGSPYNITTGRDPYSTGASTERPSLVMGATASSCTGSNLQYEAGFGCFNLNPAAGAAIPRNYATGPSNISVNLRLSRSWAFGRKGESGPADQGPPGGPGGGPPPGGGGGPPPGGPPPGGGGGPGGGGPPGGPGGFGAASGLKYNITLSVNASNAINHVNYATPSGDLSSPYFGEYRALAGGFGPNTGGSSTDYNRKITLQLRFTF